jgi:hypothetical protein
MSMKHGHCLCGAVTFEYSGKENWRAHCHCESCRRQTSSPFTTFMGVPNGAWRFTGEPPKVYVSSPGVRRLFCGTCGSPIAYEADRFPDEIHFYAVSLDDPTSFEPERHVHCDEQLPWIELNDGLPRDGKGSADD